MQAKQSSQDFIAHPETWLERYGDDLYRFALARVKDPAIAEDLVQETFVAALHGRKNFKGRSRGRTWLTAILKHKIIDHLRKKYRELDSEDMDRLSETVEGFYTGSGNWRIKPAKWQDNPLKVYEQREFLDFFYRCLSELPQRLARAFILREMEGLSTEELCKRLDISATNSWVMLYRARNYLRRCLDVTWFNPPAGETE